MPNAPIIWGLFRWGDITNEVMYCEFPASVRDKQIVMA